MQRLFTTFADSWPGVGLFIQRLITGVFLLYGGFASIGAKPAGGLFALEMSAAILGLFILVGLWTPVAGVLVAGCEVGILVLSGDFRMSLLPAVLGFTLAMIGPGAWSVDARLFGRRRIGD